MHTNPKRYIGTVVQGVLIFCVSLFSLCGANACLTFSLQHGKSNIYGRNFDWDVGVGAVIINPRHVKKRAFVLPPEKPVTWVSKYGSVTFNQFSREVPVGGMNEKGLVIESLVSTAQHCRRDGRNAINELQWIQYHLDTCGSVAELLCSARSVRISPYAVSLHYFVSDHSGKTAVIEFIDGKMLHRSAAALPVKVLANREYDVALRIAPSQKNRFARAARMIGDYDGRKDAKEYAFSILDSVAQGSFTKWQVVYDIAGRRIQFRSLKSRGMKSIAFSDCDFETVKPSMSMDVNLDASGDMKRLFQGHTREKNDALINGALKAFRKAGIMQHIKPEHIEYIRDIADS